LIERKIGYLESEVATFVIVLFLIFLHWQFQGEGQGKKQTFDYQ
jgi:hypothetical protein